MHLSGGRISIQEIAQSLAMNKRTLYRSFTNFVGLPPKTFLSILRFHRALRLLKSNKMNITNTAFEAGYSDQSHMNKDFKKLGGFTPSNMPHLDLAGFAL
jgi:AraC-like DNA-binding protein